MLSRPSQPAPRFVTVDTPLSAARDGRITPVFRGQKQQKRVRQFSTTGKSVRTRISGLQRRLIAGDAPLKRTTIGSVPRPQRPIDSSRHRDRIVAWRALVDPKQREQPDGRKFSDDGKDAAAVAGSATTAGQWRR
jgi:hypothetical protein